MMKLILPLIILISSTTKNKWPNLVMMFLVLTIPSALQTPLQTNLSLSMSTSLTQMSVALITMTLWLSALAMTASYPIFQNKKNPQLFSLSMMLITISLLFAFSMNSLMKFFIAFETTLIPTAFLIIRWGPQPERVLATLYMLLYTLTASFPLLISLLSCLHMTASLSTVLTPICQTFTHKLSLALLAAFLVKLPMYSLHQWLPKAHVEAPVAGSMMLAGILLKLGSYGIFLVLALPLNLTMLKPILSSLSLIGSSLTALMCLRQPDLKALIAYASVSHMTLTIPAMLSDSFWAWHGVFIMLIAHGLTSSGLFALVNILYENFKTRNLMMIKGLLSLSPSLTISATALFVSNMACPPFLNLPAEMFIILSITPQMNPIFILLLILTMFMTCAYSLMALTAFSQGTINTTMNPLSLTNPRSSLLMTMHLTPLLLLTLNLHFMSV